MCPATLRSMARWNAARHRGALGRHSTHGGHGQPRRPAINASPYATDTRQRGVTMGKRSRKKKARKGSAANHGKRPNS
jgi:hypothetical protein